MVSIIVPHEPPLVVNVNMIGVVELDAAVKVAVPGVLPVLLAKVPLVADHIADVAPPPNEPPKAADVPLWQIAVIADPTLTVGFGFTTMSFEAEVVLHDPPLVVNVNVIGVVELEVAV